MHDALSHRLNNKIVQTDLQGNETPFSVFKLLKKKNEDAIRTSKILSNTQFLCHINTVGDPFKKKKTLKKIKSAIGLVAFYQIICFILFIFTHV